MPESVSLLVLSVFGLIRSDLELKEDFSAGEVMLSPSKNASACSDVIIPRFVGRRFKDAVLTMRSSCC